MSTNETPLSAENEPAGPDPRPMEAPRTGHQPTRPVRVSPLLNSPERRASLVDSSTVARFEADAYSMDEFRGAHPSSSPGPIGGDPT